MTSEVQKPDKWAANMAQWVRTSLTDVYHAMGQAEIGHMPTLATRMRNVALELEATEKLLQTKYHVPPATGVGRKRRKSA